MVAKPIISRVAINVALRPMRSPKWPNIAAPIGLPTNPMKNTPNAWRTPINGDDPGKNTFPNTSPVTAPYNRKSYHSIVVPIVLANMARCKAGRYAQRFWEDMRARLAEFALTLTWGRCSVAGFGQTNSLR